MVNWSRFLFLGLVLTVVFIVPLSPARAQSAKPGATYVRPSPNRLSFWSVRPGANTVTLDPDGISMRQREMRDTTDFALATQRLTVPKRGAWAVTFEVRFGRLGSCPTAVGLTKGDTLIGWVGADAYYKVLGTFFGTDYFTGVDLSLFPLADEEWHRFEFRSDGRTISLRRDGHEVAHESSALRPDAIKIGEYHLLLAVPPPALQQTETWLRAIRAE